MVGRTRDFRFSWCARVRLAEIRLRVHVDGEDAKIHVCGVPSQHRDGRGLAHAPLHVDYRHANRSAFEFIHLPPYRALAESVDRNAEPKQQQDQPGESRTEQGIQETGQGNAEEKRPHR